ncbi:MAG: four helix bundle protein [Anaerolineae bacterium]|nr:four helix bundle protein [Anaerolineae bacterium]
MGERVRFLDIAGAISEVNCYPQFAYDLGYITQDDYTNHNQKLVEVRRMLIALIKQVRNANE